MTDDRFLNSLRSEPRPEYARSLWRRLQASAPEEDEPARGPVRLVPALAFAVLVVAVGSLVLFPSVRASAQAFLDMFRVRNFVAVEFDQSRAEKLRSLDHEDGFLVFDRKEKIQEPKPVDAPNRASAEAAVGIPVFEPAYVPSGYTRESFQTVGDARIRVGTSTERLKAVLQAVDVRNVEVPQGLDGQWIDVHVNPIARQVWVKGDDRRIVLVQAKSPEVSLPAGLDMARLGEIGLRILGVDEGEARRLARSIDWSSTLVVPVPANASSFREVMVRGHKALMVTHPGMKRPDGTPGREGSVVLWSENERVFALTGPVYSGELVQMAESLR